MIERVIENWLTNVDERGYQIPFCQLLALKGYDVVHISPHGPDEQGKDVIAISPEGTPCAYQLKAGDISLSTWRQIRGEVEELLDISIHHPSVDKSKDHLAYLVVSGELKDPVRRQIDDINNDRIGANKKTLKTILRGQLLSDLVKANEQFLPKGVDDLNAFLNLYTFDGAAPVAKERLSSLLNSVTNLYGRSSRTKAVRAAANALIFGSYLLSTFRREKNWWSLADGWVIITASVFAVAEKWKVYDQITATVELCMNGFEDALVNLEKEAIDSDDLIVGNSLFDGQFVKYRATLVAGYITAMRLARRFAGEGAWASDEVTKLIDRYKKDFVLYGEGAVPCFVNMFWYLRYSGNETLAQETLQGVMAILIRTNRDKRVDLMNPYYDLETVVRQQLGLPGEPIDETFSGNSYALESLITLAVRYNMRQFLEKAWRPITRINMSEFIPESTWETFVFRAQHGKMVSRFPKQTESWAELEKQANNVDDEDIPKGLIRYPQLAPLLFLTYPHRLRLRLLQHIDNALKNFPPITAK